MRIRSTQMRSCNLHVNPSLYIFLGVETNTAYMTLCEFLVTSPPLAICINYIKCTNLYLSPSGHIHVYIDKVIFPRILFIKVTC